MTAPLTRGLVLVLSLLAGACAAEIEPYDMHGEEDSDDSVGVIASGLSLNRLGRGCSTAGTEGLSAQLLDEMACLSGGALVPVEHPNVVPTHSRVHLYLSPEGRDALLSVARSGSEVRINSGLRTIAEQYVLWRGCRVAATPGRSNHETGRAIDVQNYSSVGRALQRAGFDRPLPSSDPVHYVAPGDDLRNLSVLAFQRLWNANNPGDRISDDGVSGPATRSRLARAPAEGFRVGRVCSATPAPTPTPTPEPPPEPTPEPTPTPVPSSGASCTHSFGGTYADTACSASWQCCDGAWRGRGSCGGCACTETSGETGCGAPAPAPAPTPTGASCRHSFGGTYRDTACSTSWQCCDGEWGARGSCGSCACVEGSGESGC
ncbi:MAG: M15 family metallopeptidase [Sandaracinaceae bacterium]